MTIKLAKPNHLILGILSGIAIVSLGVLPGNASTPSSQMNKTPTNAMQNQRSSTMSSKKRSGAMSNSGARMSPASSRMQSASNSSGVVMMGSTGQAVKDIQNSLKRMGFYNGPVDGNFGRQTQAAVIKFQQSKKLPADGVVGPKTRAAMA